MQADSDRWWPFGAPRASARARVVALPFAGGGASAFRPLRRRLGPEIDLAPLQLPGREGRIREAPSARVETLIEQILNGIGGIEEPHALFGYSMGALLAYELAQALRAAGRGSPRVLFVAAARPPHRLDRSAPLHALADEPFIDALRAMKGTPEEVLAHRELMELVLPTLRADFELCETYEHAPREPLDCPIVAFGGREDPNVPPELLDAWGEHSRAGSRSIVFSAGHFFLDSEESAIVSEMRRSLGLVP